MFFRDEGFDGRNIDEMFEKCRRLEAMQDERASQNWEYLERIGIQKRKLYQIPHWSEKGTKHSFYKGVETSSQ